MRNGWSVNLRAIENGIFSIRCIERNMGPILQTVRLYSIAVHAEKGHTHTLAVLCDGLVSLKLVPWLILQLTDFTVLRGPRIYSFARCDSTLSSLKKSHS
jgi:hypothetical protein